MNKAETVAKILLSIKAVTFSPKKPFRYSSGILSPVYTDCRMLMSFPKERSTIRDFFIETIRKKGHVDVIAGTATAGIPHAAWVAGKMNLPMIYVRGKAKDHGKGNQIEGVVKKGQKVAVIEDLISTGVSSIESVEAIKKAEGKSSHVFSIFSYGMKKAADNFKDHKIKLVSMTDFPTIIKVAVELNYITEKDKNMILQWAHDPASWGKKMGFE